MCFSKRFTTVFSLMILHVGICLGQAPNTQVVFLDFDSVTIGTIDYTLEDRNEIQEILESYFRGFSVEFTQSEPASAPYSTIFFNGGSSVADGVDFRNTNMSDNATVDISLRNIPDSDEVLVTANIAAHEIGHLLGGLHDDPYGPIGSGVPANEASQFSPPYPGPTTATRDRHIMDNRNPAIYGLEPEWFTARSAVKLTVGAVDVSVEEAAGNNDTIPQSQTLELQNLRVPNNILDGQFSGSGDFSFSAVVVLGTFDVISGDSVDFYRFETGADDLLNMEVLSPANLSVLDESGDFVSYYGTDAFNDYRPFGIQFLSLPRLVDLTTSFDGTHIVKVEGSAQGSYELFIHRFNGILGDGNHDEKVNFLDIAPFIDALISQDQEPKLDINLDNRVDFLDIGPFIDLLMEN